ncbi:MAG: hydantoinase B/oxoprolinase family protein [Stellaceae bacterium]
MANNSIDLVTFEVLKNAFVNLVDQMSEQLLRTCYSFVIYSRDFSNCLCDVEGNTVTQGTQDIASHIGTLHWTAKAVINAFRGDIHPGDVFMINDPYLGATHFPDIRVMRPVFVDGELIAFLQSNGHWADVGGRVPGSFDVTAKDHFSEGMRIPPIKIWDKGVYRWDIANMIVANMRVPNERLGDLRAQAEATRVGETRLLELVKKYGKATIVDAFEECQSYVERIMRERLRRLPDGSWETVDYIDMDPAKGDGMIPICVKMTIAGDRVLYDMTGSHKFISCFLNSAIGVTWSAIAAGTKTFFPDVPLNSGFYRVIDTVLPEGSVVLAPPPAATAGSVSGAFEKVMNAIFEIWSQVIPERALACSFNLEYLLVGGRDLRGADREFMWYDWLAGGWGGRRGKDGSNTTAPVFGVGLALQSCEVQERLAPITITKLAMLCDSGGPGTYRGGVGLEKGGVLGSSEQVVMSYCCDRAFSVTWGIDGGLPSIPHGVWLNPRTPDEKCLGVVFAGEPLVRGDHFTRPAAGGGGFGDPLKRDPRSVLEDVIDEYVSIERAALDYGVVIRVVDPEIYDFIVDETATQQLREELAAIRGNRLHEDPEAVRRRYLDGELTVIDLIRHYGVILDLREAGAPVLPRSTQQFREVMRKRAAAHW